MIIFFYKIQRRHDTPAIIYIIYQYSRSSLFLSHMQKINWETQKHLIHRYLLLKTFTLAKWKYFKIVIHNVCKGIAKSLQYIDDKKLCEINYKIKSH